MGLLKACVEVAYNLLFVHVLADEDYLLHAVSVFFVPVAHQSGFLTHQFNQVFFGGCGIPQAGFGQLFLRACLFKKVGHVAVVAEIAYAFGTDDVAAPSGGDEMVEFVNVECRTAVVNESTDAVFFHFAPFVMVMLMVSVLFVVMLVLLVVMFMFFMMMLMPFFVMMMSVRFFFFLFGGWFLYPANPSCRGSHAFEVEQVCMDNLL